MTEEEKKEAAAAKKKEAAAAKKKKAEDQDLSSKDVAAKKAKDKPSTGLIVADGGRYICKKKCTYGIRMFRKGDPLQVKKGEKIPHHFKKAKVQPEDEED